MYYLDKISLVLMKLICCAAFIFAAYLMICTFKQKNLLLFIVALPVALIASILTVRYFLPGIAEKFTYGLLMPSHHLDKAPIPLSPFYGDLANGAYQKVIREISAAPDCIFLNPEALLIYAQACMNLPEYRKEGLLRMELFFQSSRRSKGNEFNLQLLFYYADVARQYRKTADIVMILSSEAEKNSYSDHEKRAIRTRCAALAKGMTA